MIINLTSTHGNVMDSMVFFKNKTILDKTYKNKTSTNQNTERNK